MTSLMIDAADNIFTCSICERIINREEGDFSSHYGFVCLRCWEGVMNEMFFPPKKEEA